MRTLVCGVGGITGNTVTSVLAGRGLAVRALVHREQRRPAALEQGASEAVVADYDDIDSLTAAMRGVDAVFFVAASYQEAEPRWVTQVTDAAQHAGVDRFIYQSVLHPFTPSMPHHARKARSEVIVRASRLRWAIVQPAMYAQTILRIRERSADGELNVPYNPDARFAVIDVVDVACCVAEMLVNDHLDYGGYELVGPEVQSVRQMAETLNRGLGEQRRVLEVAPDSLTLPRAWGPQQRAEYALMCQEYGANGLLGSPSTAATLLGRDPTSFADVVTRDVRHRTTSGAAQ